MIASLSLTERLGARSRNAPPRELLPTRLELLTIIRGADVAAMSLAGFAAVLWGVVVVFRRAVVITRRAGQIFGLGADARRRQAIEKEAVR